MAKILIVDDNSANREFVLTLLASQGHAMIEAADGEEGLALAHSERPRLVISDVLMPTMDGYEFVRQLRADPVIASTEVIFHTAHYLEREARNLAAACGVTRVLTKPCDRADILRVVEHALAHVMPPPPIAAEFDRQHLAVLTDKLAQKAEALQAANAKLAALTELNLQLASELDPHVLLKRACRGARDLIGASYAVLAVSERAQGAPDFTTTSGINPTLVAALEPTTVAHRVFGQDLERRQPRRCLNPGGNPAMIGLPRGYPSAHAALLAPVSSLNVLYGWICLVDKLGAREFSEEDERMLAILAAQTGRIYENGSLYVELQRYTSRRVLESNERRPAAVRPGDSEQHFRQLTENINEVFFLTDPSNTEVLYVSPAYEQIWGRTCTSLYQQPASWLAAIHPDDRGPIDADRERREATGMLDYQFRILRPDGRLRWVRARGFPIRDEAGKLYRIAGLAEDISERKAAEDKVHRSNRVHAMLSGINSLIVRVLSRAEFLDEACRIAVDQGQFRFASISLVDTAAQVLHAVATAGNDPRFAVFDAVALGGDDGLTASAFGSGHAVVCNHVEGAADTLLHRAEMLAAGVRACAALPLGHGGRALGCLTLCATERDLFGAEEMRLLEELAGDIAFGLDHIEKEERLDHLAYYDAVTGLANRSLFIERLSQQLLTARRNGHKIAVVLANVERLRQINDTHGRHAGDALLQQVAKRLLQCVGSSSMIGRMDADQFAAIVIDAENESDVLRTIHRWWAECFSDPFQVETDELRISARAGIAVYPIDGDDSDTLLSNAEAALNRARASVDRLLFYAVEMSRRAARALALETRLRRALENSEFVLYYQPKIDMKTRRLAGVEALIRWQSPELGLVLPGQFIPLMEETGMILEAGAWALRRAMLDRTEWLQRHLDAPRIAVNLSAIQLRAQDLVPTFASLVTAGNSLVDLDIEVTESMIMENVEDCIGKLTALRKLGVAIAVDDFGTGYSSLAYLARLPVELLKIDRSFVHMMCDDPGAMTLVQTMISLAHSLNLKVVAEGVESEEQAKILRLLRCDQAQGFLFAKPMTADELMRRLSERGTFA